MAGKKPKSEQQIYKVKAAMEKKWGLQKSVLAKGEVFVRKIAWKFIERKGGGLRTVFIRVERRQVSSWKDK